MPPALDAAYQAGLLQLLPQGVLVLDAEQRILYANLAAEMLLGISAQGLLAHALTEFLVPFQPVQLLLARASAEKKLISEYDLPLSGPRMKEKRVLLHLLPLDAAPGTMMLVLDDSGMKNTLARSLFSDDKARATGHMASILAHEIKNPLAGIRGAAQLLRQTASGEDEALTQLICAEVDRVRDVIDEMEIFSASGQFSFEPVNIHEVLEHVTALMRHAGYRDLTLHARYDPSLPFVHGHRNLLIQLFLNLAKNAAEALQGISAPRITFSTQYHNGLITCDNEGGERHKLPIIVCVEDNGPGIDEAIRRNVFEPFVTSKSSGKGLGLAIAAKIAADHHGVIDVESEPGEGSRFRVFLQATADSL